MALDPVLHSQREAMNYLGALRYLIAERERKLAYPVVAPARRVQFEAELARYQRLLAEEERRMSREAGR